MGGAAGLVLAFAFSEAVEAPRWLSVAMATGAGVSPVATMLWKTVAGARGLSGAASTARLRAVVGTVTTGAGRWVVGA